VKREASGVMSFLTLYFLRFTLYGYGLSGFGNNSSIFFTSLAISIDPFNKPHHGCRCLSIGLHPLL